MFCHHCGSQIADDAKTCMHCGVAVASPLPPPTAAKTGGALDPIARALFPPQGKSWVVTLLLAFFGGSFGLHRFYVGKIGTAVLMLVTFGGFGVWWIIDLIRIVVGSFDDADGRPLVK